MLLKKNHHLLIFMLLAICPLIGMGVDLIASSLPIISKSLHVSSTYSKNLISIYLIGYSLGNLFTGFLSDALGRRKLILIGIFTFAVVSLVPTIFPSYSILLLTRFLQGASIGSYAVIVRAIFSDVLPQQKLKIMLTWLATMWGIGPVIGPMIGSYLQYYFGWQACFYFFAVYSALGFITLYLILPETLPQVKPLNIKLIKENFKIVVSNATFLGIIVLMGAAYSIFVAFNTLGPFLIQVKLEKSVVYFGHMALLLGCIFLISTCVCRYCVKKWQPTQILKIAVGIGLSIAVLSIVISYIYHENIPLIFISTASLTFIAGILYPTGMGMGISLFREQAGSASAVMNFINVFITGLTAFLMSFMSKNSTIMFITYASLMLIAAMSYRFFIYQPNRGSSYEKNNSIKSTT